MDQQYRDALNNARDDEINQACEAEAEREVKTIYDSAAEVHPVPSHAPPAPHLAAIQVTRRANYRAQHLRELAWREEQQQAHIAKEMEAEVSSNPALAATHRLSCTVARQLRVSRARIKGFAGLYSAVDSSLSVGSQQELAAAHLAEEEKRQWLEAQQEAAAARARYSHPPLLPPTTCTMHQARK